MTLFAVKYKSKPGLKTKYVTGSHTLEVIWTAVPFVLLMVIFVWGYSVYSKMVRSPSDAYEVRVIGKQWLWQFVYDDGKSTTNELYVPAGRPVRLVMTGQDVLHNFFIPDFRIKQDVVPGMYTSIWFHPEQPGIHQIFCAAYCGTAHSGMLAKVIALNEADWESWKRGKKIALPTESNGAGATASSREVVEKPVLTAQASVTTLAERGKAHFQSKGCILRRRAWDQLSKEFLAPR
jgi:cytochrome c oxidase subunit 2